jgi:16S rRNA (cytosine967-C5)-methyltransferase
MGCMAELNSNADRRDPPLAQLFACAAQILQGVSEGRSQSEQLRQLPAPLKAATQSISSAALRRWGLLRALRADMLSRQPRVEIEMLMDIGLSELIAHDEGSSQRSVHTLVDQAVAADWLLPQSGPAARKSARGLVNAVLRRYMREGKALLAGARKQAQARDNLPDWWRQLLQQHYGFRANALIAPGQAMAPMTLRVNLTKATVEEMSAQLTALSIEHEPVAQAALRLRYAKPVDSLPGFEQGFLSVQDLGAQLSAHLLLPDTLPANLENVWQVLDACAAPGGKTGHVAERLTLLRQAAQILAIDNDEQRLERVHENIARLGIAAQVRTEVADAADTGAWAQGRLFDRILLDAPCTAAGIISRHPDIPWLRRRGDIATLAAQQRRLLEALWSQLAPGGTLLYVTCSVFFEENEGQIQSFVSRHPDCQRMPTLLPPSFQAHINAIATAEGLGLQLLPTAGVLAHDGFFYALLRKSGGA